VNVLIVGGAGYVGSHMAKTLAALGDSVTVLDNLSTGYRDAVPEKARLVVSDLSQRGFLYNFLEQNDFDAVMHFASCIDVAESMRDPGKYYQNNVANTLKLLEAMIANGVRHFVFSSTAAVYGEPKYFPIDEDHPLMPINPYGSSKYMAEKILADFDRAHGLKYVTLRYFNAAGADPDGSLGERHDPETHLIPLLLQVAAGKREHLELFGLDYDTPDGTCIRDYVHVSDICSAHLGALDALLGGSSSATYNLGNGSGFSVLEVIAAVESVTGRRLEIREGPRRPGDPARLVADASRAHRELSWSPRFPGLLQIVEHAWAWERRLESPTRNAANSGAVQVGNSASR
jgi:UDP-glucose 4-epimerase